MELLNLTARGYRRGHFKGNKPHLQTRAWTYELSLLVLRPD